jgi:hypothetical protein
MRTLESRAPPDNLGSALYAAGWFDSAGGAPENNIARWDGVSWTALGSGMSGSSGTGVLGRVKALAVFDEQRSGLDRLRASLLAAAEQQSPSGRRRRSLRS